MTQEDVVTFVQANPGASPEVVADSLHISTRTVRKYLKACNEVLDGIAAIEYRRDESRGRGYYLTVFNEPAFESWLLNVRISHRSMLPETAEERSRFLLNDLLMRTDWITREELARILYVSPTSITQSLKAVERALGEFGMVLEKRPRYGMRVSGTELARRLCLANIAIEQVREEGLDDLSMSPLVSGGGGVQDSLMLGALDACVSRVLDETGFLVQAFAYQNLLVHIGVALMRIRAGCYIPLPDEQLEQRRQTEEYRIASCIAEAVHDTFNLRLPEEEVAYIAIHLSGKQGFSALGAASSEEAVISDEVWQVVAEILEAIWSSFRFDLRCDLELRMNLAQHIVPLSVRLSYHLSAPNPMAADIRKRYPLAWSMALEAAMVLSRRYGEQLSDDEVGYLALSLALALERQKTAPVRKNILVVCASGRGSARLMEYRYRQEFGEYVDRIEMCDVRRVGSVDFAAIDYVFTTVPLEEPVPVPIREVGFFLESDDVVAIRDLLAHERKPVLESYLDPLLFLPHLEAANKNEALAMLCDLVRAHRRVDDDFERLVMAREQAAPTSFGGLAALPHPLTPASDTSFLCVGLLDEPIDWGSHRVQAVFLLSVAHNPADGLEEFLDVFSGLMFNQPALEYLLETRSFDVLERLFSDDVSFEARGEDTS